MEKEIISMRKITGNNTLSRRLVLIFLGMMMMIILTIIIYYFAAYENSMEELTASYANNVLEDAIASVDKEIENLVENTKRLGSWPDIYGFLDADNTTRLEMLRTVRAQLSAYVSYNANIANVFLVDRQGSKISGAPVEENEAYSEIWMEYQWVSQNYDLASPFRNAVLTPHHEGVQRNGYFCILLPIYKDMAAPKDSDYLGAVVVVCSRQILDGILPMTTAGKMAIMEDDKVIFSNNSSLAYVLENEPGKMDVVIDDSEVRLITGEIASTGWQAYLICTRENLEEKMADIRKNCVLISILGMMVLIILFRLSYRSFVQPMQQIVFQIKGVDNFNKRIERPATADAEFIQLTDAINHMLEQNEQLSNDIVDARLAYYRERMLFLQTQINPHFLYNNLQCIRGMSARGNTGAVREMMTCIADIYRYGSVQNPETTLAEELGCLELYSKIIRIRYDDCFTVRMECTEEAKDCRLPRMCLQPLVENSIIHGFNEANRPTGQVVIHASVSDGKLWIEICDDGGGMSEEQVCRLNTPDKRDLEQNSHLGVENVRSRLEILFGEESTVIFKSMVEKGTCVKLCVRQNMNI